MSAFDGCVLCAKREADLVTDNELRLKLHVIETGASLDVEMPETDDAAQPLRLPPEPVVGFVGAMDYPPNIEAVRWFAESIWPRIHDQRPDAQWWIIGRSPTRAVLDLDDGRDIRVTGTVPAVEPYLERIRVNVAPLKLARGVQTKVLTAMGTGRPCVVTPCVAEGLGAEAGRELLLAEKPADFAGAVTRLLNDRVQAETIGQAGRAFVRRRYQPWMGLASIERLLQPGLVTEGVS